MSRQTRAARRLRTYGQGRRRSRRCGVVASGETVVASGETEQRTNDNAHKARLIELEQSAPRFSETLPTPCRVVRRGSPSRGTYVFRVARRRGSGGAHRLRIVWRFPSVRTCASPIALRAAAFGHKPERAELRQLAALAGVRPLRAALTAPHARGRDGAGGRSPYDLSRVENSSAPTRKAPGER
jgi:hypothetical protein